MCEVIELDDYRWQPIGNLADRIAERMTITARPDALSVVKDASAVDGMEIRGE